MSGFPPAATPEIGCGSEWDAVWARPDPVPAVPGPFLARPRRDDGPALSLRRGTFFDL
ncbi:hypothetical protein [Sphaerisporangium sp. NPDC051011]|uniref:hypothetical protein n=1 Tax=Sphaerisporangium sp. NPDC051011 TaxID=3155792 RepID=UPI0034077CCC